MVFMPPALSNARRWLSLRSLARIALGLIVVYALGIVLLIVLEDRILYAPTFSEDFDAASLTGCAVQEVSFHTADGTPIHGRWFACEKATSAALIFHGRAGNLTLDFGPDDLAGWHKEVGVSAFVFSYPGYGKSGGIPSEAGCYAAAEAAYAWLTEVQKVPPSQVLLYGRSLGSAIAIDIASRHPHRALILVTPFTSVPDVAESRFPLLPAQMLMHNRFPSRAKIALCTRPVMVLHGTDDLLVPFAQGKELFDLANEPKRFIPVVGGSHEDCITAAFFSTIRNFLAEMEPVRRAASP
jgi:uncharacterized protein